MGIFPLVLWVISVCLQPWGKGFTLCFSTWPFRQKYCHWHTKAPEWIAQLIKQADGSMPPNTDLKVCGNNWTIIMTDTQLYKCPSFLIEFQKTYLCFKTILCPTIQTGDSKTAIFNRGWIIMTYYKKSCNSKIWHIGNITFNTKLL